MPVVALTLLGLELFDYGSAAKTGLALGWLVAVAIFVFGLLWGPLVFASYLWLTNENNAEQHSTELFGGLQSTEYKNFLRLRLDNRDRLTIYPVASAAVRAGSWPVKAPPTPISGLQQPWTTSNLSPSCSSARSNRRLCVMGDRIESHNESSPVGSRVYTMAVGRFYEGTLVERETGYGFTAVTVPSVSALAWGTEVLSTPVACANALEADFLRPVEGWQQASAVVAAVLDGAPPQQLDAYFEFMARRENKTFAEAELRANPVWKATDVLMFSELVPFEASPLSGESLATLVGSGGLASAAGVVVVTTGVVPALALLGVGAAGIVLVHAAEGVGEGLRERLRRWAAGQDGQG